MMRLSLMLCHVSKMVRRFGRDKHGTAAIEFSFIVPALAIVVIPLVDVANFAAGVDEMQAGVRSTIQYAMNGGTDMSVAQSHGMAAWAGRPADGTMTVVLACLCDSSAHACDAPCPDGTPPQSFVTVTASGTFTGNLFTQNKTITAKVRVR